MNAIESFIPIVVGVLILLLVISAATKKLTLGPFDKEGKDAQTRGQQLVSWEKKTASKLARRAGKGALRSCGKAFRRLFP